MEIFGPTELATGSSKPVVLQYRVAASSSYVSWHVLNIDHRVVTSRDGHITIKHELFSQ